MHCITTTHLCLQCNLGARKVVCTLGGASILVPTGLSIQPFVHHWTRTYLASYESRKTSSRAVGRYAHHLCFTRNIIACVVRTTSYSALHMFAYRKGSTENTCMHRTVRGKKNAIKPYVHKNVYDNVGTCVKYTFRLRLS